MKNQIYADQRRAVLDNAQRPYFGLNTIDSAWDVQELKTATIFFDGCVVKKVIAFISHPSNDEYLEWDDNLDGGFGGYWVEAKDLRVGDVFLGSDGKFSTLTGLLRVEQEGGIEVFNFSVEGNANYFVLQKNYDYGQTSVLVHNASEAYKTARRFVSRSEYKNIKKNGITFNPNIGSGIPATTTKVAARVSDWLKNVLDARYAKYYVDIDLSGICYQIKRTKAGVTEITIMGNVPVSAIIGGGRVR
ncbi:MAG: hypothetical protein ACRC2T_08335 [Thermoguttaceae bacterium]